MNGKKANKLKGTRLEHISSPAVCLTEWSCVLRRPLLVSMLTAWKRCTTLTSQNNLQKNACFAKSKKLNCVFMKAYACGMVVLKMSSMQLHVLSHVSSKNFSPFRMTTFSRQLVPERASCSLSVNRGKEWILKIRKRFWGMVYTSEALLHTHLAAHTSRAEPRCHPAEHRWGPRSTGWRRHIWHKVHGCRWWSSILLSEDARQSRWDQDHAQRSCWSH